MKNTLKNESKLKAQLLAYRKEIDKADDQILKALSQRLRVVEKIGIVKLKNNLPLLQKARWKELVADRILQAQKLGLRSVFTKGFLEVIHREAIDLQRKQRKKKSVKL